MTHPIVGVPPPQSAVGGLLAGLTPEQAAAVTHGSGPLLLLAGPGAGKTKTPPARSPSAGHRRGSGRSCCQVTVSV